MPDVASSGAPQPRDQYSQYRDTHEVASVDARSPTLPFGATPSLYSTNTFSTASFSDNAFELENMRRKYRRSQEDLQRERERLREQEEMYEQELAAREARHQRELAAARAQRTEPSSGKGKRRG